MKKIFLGLTFTAAVLFAGCMKADDSICKYDACAYKAPDTQIATLQHYIDSVGVSATAHCSGLFYAISDSGTGAKASDICANILVRYRGTLGDGTEFDSNMSSSVSELVPFQLGTLIESWKTGIMLLKKGGTIRLYVPPALGYGSRDIKDTAGNIVIPANSILIFDIQLLDVY